MTFAEEVEKVLLSEGPVRDAHVAWRDLDFVQDKGVLEPSDSWAPREIPIDADAKGYKTACNVGVIYCLEMLAYMFSHPEVDKRDVISHVVHSAIERGQWGGVEIGFFSALGEYVLDGEVYIDGTKTHSVIATVRPRGAIPAAEEKIAAGADQTLVDLWDRRRRIMVEYDPVAVEADEVATCDPARNHKAAARLVELDAELLQIDRVIMGRPAAGPVGLAVKFELAFAEGLMKRTDWAVEDDLVQWLEAN